MGRNREGSAKIFAKKRCFAPGFQLFCDPLTLSGSNRFAPELAELRVCIFEAFAHDSLCARQAFAAAASHAQLRANCLQRVSALGYGVTYGLVGHVVANADDHGDGPGRCKDV